MFDLRTVESALRTTVDGLDAGTLDGDGDGAVQTLDAFDAIERLAAAGKALVAARIESTEVWRGNGSRDAVGFVATRTGASRARIRDGLAVVAGLPSASLLGAAFRGGALTIDQAADIVAAVTEHPETEAELIRLAATATSRQLKDRCIEILAQGEGAEQQHRRAEAERSASSNVGRDGIWRLSARLPIIDGAFVDKALDFFQTQIFDDARARGARDPYDAYRADALVAMARAAMGAEAAGDAAEHAGLEPEDDPPGDDRASKGGRRRRRRRGVPSSSTRHAIVVTVPHTTFLTGRPVPGETCRIPGVGPVPVSVVHQLLDGDPIIKAVVTKGRDITAVATLTRSVKDDLRLAVLAANDLTCAVPGCSNRRFLELDHEHEFHKGGATSYDNLRPLCCFHHDQRTRENYELRGSPGSYEWVAPDGTVLSAERSAVPA